MRILVDNSGYHLLNLGDISMLQMTTARLKMLWPEASIEVITYSEERLHRYAPGTVAVGVDFLKHPLIERLPRKAKFALVQFHKILLPKILSLAGKTRASANSARCKPGPHGISLQNALINADLVVASGGGYITDSFRLHGIGVLTTLDYANRMGKPTAMFGQGIGPLKTRLIHQTAASVLPRLNLLSLREGKFGPELLKYMGVAERQVLITGDDAVEMAYTARPAQLGNSLGVNLRIAQYSGVGSSVIEAIKSEIQNAAGQYSAALIPVPISLYASDSDSKAIEMLVAGYPGKIDQTTGIDTPIKVIQQIAKCRVLVTGSYHAAVFALAQGIPSICLTNSAYYDYKFAGLLDLYGGSCRIVSLADPNFKAQLGEAIRQAWVSAETNRDQTLQLAADQMRRSLEAYQCFAALPQLKAWPSNRIQNSVTAFAVA